VNNQKSSRSTFLGRAGQHGHVFVAVAGIEEGSMFWWIVDLFLDRDWSDLLGLISLIAVLIALAVLLIAH
jgi:hypothetical protein